MNKLNLLLLVAAATVLLVALNAEAGFDFGNLFNKNKDKDNNNNNKQQQEVQSGGAQNDAPKTSGGKKTRVNLDKVREAKEEQDRLAAEAAPKYPKRPGYQAGGEGSVGRNSVQGRRRFQAQQQQADQQDEEDEEEEDDDDEPDGYDEAMATYRRQQGEEPAAEGAGTEAPQAGFLSRIKNKKVRDQMAAKFVSTHQGERAELARPKVNVRRVKPNVRRGTQGDGRAESAAPGAKKPGNFWGKHLGKALKGAKKGFQASAAAIADLPKYVEQAADSVNALLQLDGKGKLLALIERVKSDIHFVRKEFSQFTLSWSPIMEGALDYLGDTGLDKIKWNDRDELDMRKDALHSLVIGYEFMRLMVAWRESLLISHEAYRLWLESLKQEYETKKFEVDEDLIMQLSTIHNYLLLSGWQEIDERAYEARAKLEHLMEMEDDRPKNYESEYFRNIIVLQEMYFPTMDELEQEEQQVTDSISTSGVVVDNLEQVTDFYENFRTQVLSGEQKNVDCKVPQELEEFLAKLGPQLEHTSLVYTKGFVRELREMREQREQDQADQ